MGTEIRKQFCSQLGGLQQRSAEQKASTCSLKIFRILSPGKPKQLALPGSSKEFYKGLKMSFSNSRNIAFFHFSFISNQIPNLFTFTFSCIRTFPTISIVTVCVCVCYLVMSDSLQPHGLQSARLLCPWNSPSKNTGVGCCCCLWGIFYPQGLNPDLLHCRQILDHLNHQGGPPFSLPLPQTMLSSLGH